jgi:hypothetical protein
MGAIKLLTIATFMLNFLCYLGMHVYRPYGICLILKRILGIFPFLSFWIKRGYDSKKAEKRFLDHIRVLSFWISFWIKRGYGLKKAEKRFLDHIRVLSFWIKRGYDSKKAEKVF